MEYCERNSNAKYMAAYKWLELVLKDAMRILVVDDMHALKFLCPFLKRRTPCESLLGGSISNVCEASKTYIAIDFENTKDHELEEIVPSRLMEVPDMDTGLDQEECNDTPSGCDSGCDFDGDIRDCGQYEAAYMSGAKKQLLLNKKTTLRLFCPFLQFRQHPTKHSWETLLEKISTWRTASRPMIDGSFREDAPSVDGISIQLQETIHTLHISSEEYMATHRQPENSTHAINFESTDYCYPQWIIPAARPLFHGKSPY
jgi:hypothetical protein